MPELNDAKCPKCHSTRIIETDPTDFVICGDSLINVSMLCETCDYGYVNSYQLISQTSSN